MQRHSLYQGRKQILMTFEELFEFNPTGYEIREYDPTLHCDNKCLRAGYCRFRCTSEIELLEMPPYAPQH